MARVWRTGTTDASVVVSDTSRHSTQTVEVKILQGGDESQEMAPGRTTPRDWHAFHSRHWVAGPHKKKQKKNDKPCETKVTEKTANQKKKKKKKKRKSTTHSKHNKEEKVGLQQWQKIGKNHGIFSRVRTQKKKPLLNFHPKLMCFCRNFVICSLSATIHSAKHTIYWTVVVLEATLRKFRCTSDRLFLWMRCAGGNTYHDWRPWSSTSSLNTAILVRKSVAFNEKHTRTKKKREKNQKKKKRKNPKKDIQKINK